MKGEKEMENVYVCVFEREREGGREEGGGRGEGGGGIRGERSSLSAASGITPGTHLLCLVTFKCRTIKSSFLTVPGKKCYICFPACGSAGKSLAVCMQDHIFASMDGLFNVTW